MKIKKGALKLWWIPQVPMKPFEVSIDNLEEGVKLLNILADYDIFQFENKIKPDYSNTGGLMEYDGKEWSDVEEYLIEEAKEKL